MSFVSHLRSLWEIQGKKMFTSSFEIDLNLIFCYGHSSFVIDPIIRSRKKMHPIFFVALTSDGLLFTWVSISIFSYNVASIKCSHCFHLNKRRLHFFLRLWNFYLSHLSKISALANTKLHVFLSHK
jgi:hypothetical protein